jgi:HSP20 family protein
MALIRWSPARDLTAFPSDILNMQREINRMFDGFFRGEGVDDTSLGASAWMPAVDIAEHDDEFVVKLELPGVAKDDVKITMQNNILTVRGEKKQEKESKSSNYHRVERSYGSFQRSFTLPATVKSEKIDATYKDGILSVTLPKAEEAKPKMIDVKVK